MEITALNKCSGCAACADSCPKNCITMTYDEYGFYRPIVDETICVKCGKCISICPQNTAPNQNEIQSIYKGFATDIQSESNQKSTSGAISSLLAEEIIARGGVVVGAAFDESFNNVKHIICENMSQVDLCRGSKYIQSETQGIYRLVKTKLDKGQVVLFSGTPCQIAAIKAYLKDDPPNLFTVDLICHGVGSTRFFKEYLDSVRCSSGSETFSHVGFRDKCGHYRDSQFRILSSAGVVVKERFAQTNYFGKAFANNLISRESCGTCQFAKRTRVSDITLADNFLFNSKFEATWGSSLIFVNTEKGALLLESIREKSVIEELEKEKVLPLVAHLNHPSEPHKNRKKILNAMVKRGFKKATKYLPRDPIKKRVARLLRRAIRHFKRKLHLAA